MDYTRIRRISQLFTNIIVPAKIGFFVLLSEKTGVRSDIPEKPRPFRYPLISILISTSIHSHIYLISILISMSIVCNYPYAYLLAFILISATIHTYIHECPFSYLHGIVSDYSPREGLVKPVGFSFESGDRPRGLRKKRSQSFERALRFFSESE